MGFHYTLINSFNCFIAQVSDKKRSCVSPPVDKVSMESICPPNMNNEFGIWAPIRNSCRQIFMLPCVEENSNRGNLMQTSILYWAAATKNLMPFSFTHRKNFSSFPPFYLSVRSLAQSQEPILRIIDPQSGPGTFNQAQVPSPRHRDPQCSPRTLTLSYITSLRPRDLHSGPGPFSKARDPQSGVGQREGGSDYFSWTH